MPRWQDTYKYAKLVMSLVAKTDRHEADIKALQAEVKSLTAAIQQMAFDQQRDRDRAEFVLQLIEKDRQMAAKDQELLLVRLEAKLLQYERRPPPPTGGSLDEDVL